MAIGSAINAKLLGTAGVSAICSTRGFPDVLPNNATLPAYVYTTISDIPAYQMGGEAGVATARVQIDCYAATRKDCDALAAAIRTAISGQRFTQGSYKIRTCHIDNAFTDEDQPIDGTQAWRYLTITDFLINYV